MHNPVEKQALSTLKFRDKSRCAFGPADLASAPSMACSPKLPTARWAPAPPPSDVEVARLVATIRAPSCGCVAARGLLRAGERRPSRSPRPDTPRARQHHERGGPGPQCLRSAGWGTGTSPVAAEAPRAHVLHRRHSEPRHHRPPLRQLTGSTEFREVSSEPCRCRAPTSPVEVNQGWEIRIHTLANERGTVGPRTRIGRNSLNSGALASAAARGAAVSLSGASKPA